VRPSWRSGGGRRACARAVAQPPAAALALPAPAACSQARGRLELQRSRTKRPLTLEAENNAASIERLVETGVLVVGVRAGSAVR